MATNLPPRLQKLKDEIEGYAREYGLDFFETIFEVLTYDEINMVAAYGGFPTRYPHWRWGMEYEQLSKGYEYGLSKIYEMVINTDPCYAYLLEANAEVDQKIVMAHVYGHCDFFKNNYMFAHTNRKMMDVMANHGTRARRWADKLGIEAIEDFIDRCLSLENLIDRHSPYIKRHLSSDPEDKTPKTDIGGFKVDREYMRGFVNPQAYMDGQKKKLEAEKLKAKKFPEHPQRDVLLFLLENAPLEQWEADILGIVREEAYYFSPQGQTKIMNEGWASYWHSKILTTRALKDDELIDYADHHSGTMGGSQTSVNPYKLGIELYRHIEDRWNKGRFGKEYDECDDMRQRQSWDLKLGLGRDKIFEVRKHYNDVTFIDEFLTPEFCKEQMMFVYGYNDKRQAYEIIDRDFKKIKNKLLNQLTNFGQPVIEVVDGNHENRGELLLAHKSDGQDLKLDEAKETLVNVSALWRRPVSIITKNEGKGLMMRFDGKDHSEKKVDL